MKHHRLPIADGGIALLAHDINQDWSTGLVAYEPLRYALVERGQRRLLLNTAGDLTQRPAVGLGIPKHRRKVGLQADRSIADARRPEAHVLHERDERCFLMIAPIEGRGQANALVIRQRLDRR
ncbi:MAG: hypothetical protein IID36_10330 [Planctomycetes bacterium]|nr:hypothetical protein [Planctomycetota bacterium]